MKRIIRVLSLNIILLFFSFPIYGENLLNEIFEVNAMIETRAGFRTKEDKKQKANSITDFRFRGEIFGYLESMEFKFTGDYLYNNIKEETELITREAWLFLRPFENIDIKAGRQVLTWGTGDLVFLNDLFPKDWQSFFIGRNDEFLKAPSDSIKLSLFNDFFDFDIVYNPIFKPDRFIDGTYISYFDDSISDFAGKDEFPGKNKPDEPFFDDEIHLRIYKNINNYELAFYGYSGFWKSPSSSDENGKKIFTKMDSAGVSLRGGLGSGIANMEFVYYRSKDDEDGNKPGVKNSELRYLAGYSFDPVKDLNLNIQYYIEQVCDYTNYSQNIAKVSKRDQFRKVITASIVKLLMNQNLKLIFSGYYSPSDEDIYFRPKISYQFSDSILVETGANIFSGKNKSTFFAQFENNTNIYIALSAYF